MHLFNCQCQTTKPGSSKVEFWKYDFLKESIFVHLEVIFPNWTMFLTSLLTDKKYLFLFYNRS